MAYDIYLCSPRLLLSSPTSMVLHDGWRTDPWVMECVDEYVYGRGVTDDKGPIVATLHAVKELQVDWLG